MSLGRKWLLGSSCAGLSLAALVVVGCSSFNGRPDTRLPAIGPASGSPYHPKARAVPGELIVYTDTVASDQGRIRTVPHREYTIRDEQGGFVRRVLNHTLSSDENPEMVSLPPGKYRVTGPGAGLGVVEVPVLITPNEVTEVYIDAVGMKPQFQPKGDIWVRLPDRRVVGRRAVGY